MDPNSKSSIGWHLHISIADAQTDTREAPWYGPWNIVLRDCLFSSFCTPPSFTLTNPQFPVSTHVDTCDPDESDNDDDRDGGSSRSGAPSPEIFRGSRDKLPSTPPKIPAEPHIPRMLKRSTRIPDFVQLLYMLMLNRNGTVVSPIKYRRRVILLVEIKKAVLRPSVRAFADVLPQTDQQARHALHTSPDTQILGVIIALGACWTYVEYHRTRLQPSPSLSEKKDPTYKDTTPDPQESWMTDYPPFAAYVADDTFLRLETPQSDNGLLMIRRRLQELNF